MPAPKLRFIHVALVLVLFMQFESWPATQDYIAIGRNLLKIANVDDRNNDPEADPSALAATAMVSALKGLSLAETPPHQDQKYPTPSSTNLRREDVATQTDSNTYNYAASTTEPKAEIAQKKVLQLLPCPALGDSQDNQDCIIEKIFNNVGATNRYYVEYGFNTNSQCSFSKPNTCRLWKSGSWKGLLLDADHYNETINLRSHYLYANNIVSILDKYKVPKELDFYSGDMDSHDYFVMKSVLDSGKYRPRLITTEYNSNWPMDWAVSQVDPTIAYPDQEPPPYTFQNCVWGASPAAFRYLMERHGYSLVAVTHVLDLFWVRNDVLEARGWEAPPYEEVIKGFIGHQLHPPQSNILFLSKLVDVKVYEETKSYRIANRAMIQTILAHMKSTSVTTIPCLGGIRPAAVEAYLEQHPVIGRHLLT